MNQTLMRTDGKFSVGIIGVGNVVTSNHLPVLKAMDNVEVAWIADARADRAIRTARAYQSEAFDLASGLENLPRADAVLLAIPYGVRDPYYQIFATRLSTAIYVEKPFARTVEEHRRLCQPFEDYAIGCGLNRRAWGIVQLVRQIIDDRLFGTVKEVRYGMGSLGGIRAAGTLLENSHLSGGGMLIEGGVHGIDTALYCLRAQALTLSSGKMILDEGHAVHSEGTFLIRDSHGKDIPFELEVTLFKNTINQIEFRLDNALMSFSIFGTPRLSVESPNKKHAYILSNRQEYYPATWNQNLFEFWNAFLSGFKERKANWTSAVDSLLTTQAIEDLYALAKPEVAAPTPVHV